MEKALRAATESWGPGEGLEAREREPAMGADRAEGDALSGTIQLTIYILYIYINIITLGFTYLYIYIDMNLATKPLLGPHVPHRLK